MNSINLYKSNYLSNQRIFRNFGVGLFKEIKSFTLIIPLASCISVSLGFWVSSVTFILGTIIFCILIKTGTLQISSIQENDLLFKKSKIIKLLNFFNPTYKKYIEKNLKLISDVGYYFDEDLSFLKQTNINSFISFYGNRDLQKYIVLLKSDTELSKEFAKIIMISKDTEFKNLDSSLQTKIISKTLVKFIKLSLEKIIEYNGNNKNSKIRLTILFPNGIDRIKILDYIKIDYIKKFNDLNVNYKNISDIEELSILLDDEILINAMKPFGYSEYKDLVDILINKLTTRIERLEEKKLLESNIIELEEKIINKYKEI